MRVNLRSRIEKLQVAITPKGRVFCMFDDSNQFEHYYGPDLDTRRSRLSRPSMEWGRMISSSSSRGCRRSEGSASALVS
jgi:hypothetical protein